MILYRTPKPAEAQQLWSLMNQLDHETKYMLYEPGERQQKAGDISIIKNLISDVHDQGDFLLIAESSQQMVGYISAQRGRCNRIAHSAYIVVGILQDFQHQGIGTEFFRQLDIWALNHHVSRLELTVICENVHAKHLYETHGFQIEGVKRNSILLDGQLKDEFYMGKLCNHDC